MNVTTSLQTTLGDYSYQKYILQHVSRTFALTIPELPEKLSQVAGNAYLLCRIADTIEDDKDMPAEHKAMYAKRFVQVVKGNEPSEDLSLALLPNLSEQATRAEKDLIANMPAVLRLTHGFNRRQRASMERCVEIMTEGMTRYQINSESLNGLADIHDMGKYCYYVAGVVGELLTELFCDYSAEIDAHKDKLMKLAVSFGQGLQMTNILKDIWEDHQRGACWLPRDIFAKYHIDLAKKNLYQDTPAFNQAVLELLGIAHAHVYHALCYTLLIPKKESQLRCFCLFALNMAVLTLNQIRKNSGFSSGKMVKISRYQLKMAIFLSKLFARQDRMLGYLFDFFGKGLPIANTHDCLAATWSSCSVYCESGDGE